MREHSPVPRLVEADDKFPRQRASVCTLPRASRLGAATSVAFFTNARMLDVAWSEGVRDLREAHDGYMVQMAARYLFMFADRFFFISL